MLSSIVLTLTIFTSSLAAAALALVVLARFSPPPRRLAAAHELYGQMEQTAFLFDHDTLIDATRPARALLAALPGPGSDWARLSDHLARSVDQFAAGLAELTERSEVDIAGAAGSGLAIRAERMGDLTRIVVNDTSSEGAGILVDALSLRAQENELGELRECLSHTPMLIWRTDASGTIVWANGAYLGKVMERDGIGADEMTWPIPALFVHSAPHEDATRRISIPGGAAGAEQWYDCHSFASGEGTLYYALPANAAVRAERALRDFVQTLSRTFAHVPIGLAIFDRSRQLQLFNPALLDLTQLDTEFLSSRPSLRSFLDRLREARVIPEPKDYGLWRQQMADVERDAASGQYAETWQLPSGLTYRVTGQPHADGGLAFLFQDISVETRMTQGFRRELQLSQTVIDMVDEAIAVFSAAGELILSNTAYGVLWQVDQAATLGAVRILDAVRHWRALAQPNPIWGDIRDFVGDMRERAEWHGDCRLRDGRTLACRVVPLPGGATLVGFSALPESLPRPEPQEGDRPAREVALP